jgi:hypothetical protein
MYSGSTVLLCIVTIFVVHKQCLMGALQKVNHRIRDHCSIVTVHSREQDTVQTTCKALFLYYEAFVSYHDNIVKLSLGGHQKLELGPLFVCVQAWSRMTDHICRHNPIHIIKFCSFIKISHLYVSWTCFLGQE